MSSGGQTFPARLPLELQELTLQYLSYDRRSLLRASVVCKDWRNICISALFASIDLSSKPGEKLGARFKEFSEMTRAPRPPNFLARIQHIKMGGGAKPTHILKLQADRLGSLTSIRVFGGLRDKVNDTDYYGAISKQFPGLNFVDLAAAPFKKRSTVLDFLSSLAGLRDLTLGNMQWFIDFEDPNSPVPPDVAPLPPIEHLRIVLKTMEHVDRHLLAWMGNQLQTRRSLKFLEYTALVASPPSSFSRHFLQCVSSTLERMSLDFEMGSVVNGILMNPTCIYHALTTLNLGFPILEVQYGVRPLDEMYPKRGHGRNPHNPLQLPSIGGLSEALQHVSAPLLSHLTFRFFAEPDVERDGKALCSLSTLRSIDFSTLDKRLATPTCPFPSLKNVVLACGDLFPSSPFREFFFLEEDHGAMPYYIRAPRQSVAGLFQDCAAAFLPSAFPRLTTQKAICVSIVGGPMGMEKF